MEWVAGWDSYDPAQTAAEILLMEDDLHYHREDSNPKIKVKNNDRNFVDGILTADHMMKNKSQHRRWYPDALSDKKSFEDWLETNALHNVVHKVGHIL